MVAQSHQRGRRTAERSTMADCFVECGVLIFIRGPLAALKTNMIRAAALHNDEVEQTLSPIAEISDLSKVFDGMNQQLLIARSFVPEAVLIGKTEGSHDAEDDDEGSFEIKSTTQHSRQPSSAAPRGHKHEFDFATITEETSQQSKTSSNGMAKLFNVIEKRVGVLSLNIVGFHALCTPDRVASRANKTNSISTTLLTLAVACSHRERGVMDSFHGDHFILTFNASRSVTGPLAAAVRAADNFISQVHEALGATGVAAGAAAGKALVGTFGIDGYRRMSVVGEPYRTAVALQLAAVQHLRINGGVLPPASEGCMVDESAPKELSNSAIRLQIVGCAQSAQQRAKTTTAPPKGASPVVYSARPCRDHVPAADGEWLYELDEIEASDPFVEPNRILQALMRGELELCARALEARCVERGASIVEIAMGESVSSGKSFTGHDCDDTPAWRYVRHCYNATKEFASVASAHNAAMSVVQQCSIPYLYFQQ